MLRVVAFLLLVSACILLYLASGPGWSPFIAIALAAVSGLLFASSRTQKPEDRQPTVEMLAQDRRLRDLTSSYDKLLSAALSGMREGVVVVDENFRVIASNTAANTVFPRAEGGLKGHRLSDLTRNRAVFDAFQKVIQANAPAEANVEMLDDERRVFDLRVVPLSLGDERVIQGAMGVFFDLTQIERLERVRQEFLSNVSHELRTPLTAILAFVETLEEGAIDDQENRYRFLGIIRKNSERMRNLINDILDLSAIEAGIAVVEPAKLALRAIVNEIATALSSRADDRDVIIENRVPAGTFVYADPRRLEQMLTNLMDNAVKFNRPGGTVTVTYESGERDRICVIDTGEGIGVDHIARIFERFYRVDSARSREMGGTGLGLAIVKHLARLHGGEVSVQSGLGEGSSFVIDIPRLAGEKIESVTASKIVEGIPTRTKELLEDRKPDAA